MPDSENKPSQQPTQTQQPNKPAFPSNTTTREGDQPRRPVFPDNSATKDATEIIRRRQCESDN